MRPTGVRPERCRASLALHQRQRAPAGCPRAGFTSARERPELSPKLSPKLSPTLSPKLCPELSPKLSSKLSPKLSPELSPKLRPKLRPKLCPELRPASANQLLDRLRSGLLFT